MKLFIIIFLTLTSYSCFPTSSKPLVVNGQLTKAFKPVVKLNMKFMGSIGSFPIAEYGFCSGTFISNGVVLTAAHCFDSLQGFIQGISINISNEQAPRKIKRLKISKEYRKCRSLGKSECEEFDIALIEIESKATDQFYEVSTEALYNNDDIQVVGFGASVNANELIRRQESYNHAKKDLSQAFTDILNSNYELTKKYYKVKYEYYFNKVKAESQALAKIEGGQKRYGANKISQSRRNIYIIHGLTTDQRGAKSKQSLASLGDSGGPLIRKINGEYKVFGVLSTGYVHVYNWAMGLIPVDAEMGNNIYINLSSNYARNFIENFNKHD